ncbi:transcriptional regulator, TetR family [Hydrocarboniphaga daqingensis]|uniref:Transcriptional regulator, TetR family n=1 Tax=Hydrocarboniphaga daqingensis TaxID=490188 RepID=A0A1M5MYB7_9GAMM|nr:TetR/AcrR family transcriptional regulator [Hydrocarboniphaga daqingensis]SHG82336.1 transcriptional regulator, TetR family [Hydrocarboniphaga daqingensis]
MAYKRSTLMQERLADNRERILKAARALVAEGGFRQASVTAVAQSAGLSTGALYRYFPSKAELFVEVLGAAVAHEVAILGDIARGDGSATQRLRAAVESFARRALQGPYLAYAFIAEPADPEVEAARLIARAQIGDVFKKLLKDGIASGEFPKQSVDIGAACIVGAFTEALVRPVAPTAKRVTEDKLVEGIADFCLRAVGARVGG